jgi:hypothetical protein
MRAFVIRPFSSSGGIDFRHVHMTLIAPALKLAGYAGSTTEAIVEAGIIHESMFLELIEADLVVADVSVHNANVFYELGIRHALRPRATVLLRAQPDTAAEALPRAEIPFDIHGVRYFGYDRHHPEKGVDELVTVIRDTAASRATDSPVFRLLPDLVVDAARLQTVPTDLQEEIEVHRLAGSKGDLRLLAEDVVGMRFEERALRLIASAQTTISDRQGARDSWEQVRARRPDDYQANHQLATILARLGEPARSDQAIDRALGTATLTAPQRAELFALRGSNLKDRWRNGWKDMPADDDRQRAALRSPILEDAIAAYTTGFRFSLDNYYAGLNAVALASVQRDLIERHPDIWRTNHLDDAAAAVRLEELQRLQAWLVPAVRASLDNRADESRRGGRPDPWLWSSIADFELATSEDEDRVTAAYQRAAQGLDAASRASVLRQLEFFQALGFRAELTAVVATSLGQIDTGDGGESAHVLLFRGHMIDPDGGTFRRFPADREDVVRTEIERHLQAQRNRHRSLIGFAAASDGGDILFHECCHALDIPTQVFLPVPDRMYRGTSLTSGRVRTSWLARYIDVLARSKVHTLNPAVGLPSWVDLRRDDSSWERANRWMLHHASAHSGNVTLLALWDGQKSKGPGGVSHMVELAQAWGTGIDIIDITQLPNPMTANQPEGAADQDM